MTTAPVDRPPSPSTFTSESASARGQRLPGRSDRPGRGRGPGRRPPWQLLGWSLVALILYVVVSGVQVTYAAGLVQNRPAQAIVVLGSAEYDGLPSPDLAARLSHALSLWQRHVAPVIVTCGGKQPGDVYTEAAAGANYLADRSVPQADLMRVTNGRDTWESLTAVASVLEARGITRVLLVSDPFHDERIRLMAGDLDLRPEVSPTHTSPIRGSHVVPYYLKETAEVALGRIIGFRHLSELTHG